MPSDVPTIFTTDSGSATPVANNLNIFGGVGIDTSAVGDTITITNTAGAGGTTSFATDSGSATPAAGVITFDGVNNITFTGAGSTVSANVTGTTNHAVQVGNATASLTSLGVGTNGQALIGSTGADPVFATLTSSDSSIAFTTGAGSLSLQVASGTTVGKTITGDSGGALSPTAGNWNLLGSGSITTSGAASTLTTQLTGLTNHAVLVGAGTATITKVGPSATAGQVFQSAGAAADPVFSTATYPSTTTVSQILYSSSANVVAGLATANRGVLTTGTTGIPVVTALATDGQLIIGSTAGAPAAATLTAGTNISISNGSNSITINATGGGLTWSEITSATQTLAVANGYVTNRAGGVTYTLPATAALGDTIKVVGKAGLATITPNANQQILIGSASGAVGATGTAVATNAGDCIEIICTTSGASTVWRADSVVGTWILT